MTLGQIALRRVVGGIRTQLFALPHLLSFALILPALVSPHVGTGASEIAGSPMFVLLEARASLVFAAPGIHAIVSILHARQLLAIPDRLICLLPGIGSVIPLVVRRACFVATCPVVVLQEAMTFGVLARLGLHAIVAIVSSR